MVVASLSIGGVVGIVLSAGFVYWEVGRYATPQVPETLFDERKELAAYTVGLFVGVPLAVAYLLFVDAMVSGGLLGALAFLALLVGGTELAQILLRRTRYWGGGPSHPFYVLGFRAAIGGILALAIVAGYLGGVPLTPLGVAGTAVEALAVVALEVAGALLSLRTIEPRPTTGGGPFVGALFGAIGFFLLGLGALTGGWGALGGGVLALAGAAFVYRRLRPALARVPPPSGSAPPPPRDEPPAFGRTRATPATESRVESTDRRPRTGRDGSLLEPSAESAPRAPPENPNEPRQRSILPRPRILS